MEATAQVSTRLTELEAERRVQERDVRRWAAEVRPLAEEANRPDSNGCAARLADLQQRIHSAERRSAEIYEETLALGQQQVTQEEVERALAVFDPVWDALAPRGQARVVHLLVERVDYDGGNDQVSITIHPNGIKALADEIAGHAKEKCA